jgi:anthranilate phosphoribosyltransferase
MLGDGLAQRRDDETGGGGDVEGAGGVATGAAGVHSADVLEALGVKLELGPEQVATCIEEVGFGFMFAPTYHPAMRHVGPTRREIGIRTVFNILGPLTNPAGAQFQVLGVADPKLLRLMGEALLRLGCARALIVHGEDGLDELSLSAPTRVVEVAGERGDLREYTVHPEELGLALRPREAILGGDAQQNADCMRSLLAGHESGPLAEMVSLNAGAALYVTGRSESLGDGVREVSDALRSGRATATLDALAAKSRALAAVTA